MQSIRIRRAHRAFKGEIYSILCLWTTQFSNVQSTGPKRIAIDESIASPPTCGLLHPYAPEFRPSSHFGVATELTLFLLRKDFLLSRFSSFDDQLNSFEIWKTTFTHIIKELNVTPLRGWICW
jgi:hypothetical protein